MLIGVMQATEAEDLLHYCMDQGEVTWGPHFSTALRHEKLVMIDALEVLKRGRIYSPAEEDIKTGEWKYRVEGYEPDGKWLAILFSFKKMDRAFLITVFSVRARSK